MTKVITYRAPSEADLSGADLSGANLAGANLAGARGIISAGMRSDGYAFFLVKHPIPMIQVGCRWFPLAEAREHLAQTRGGTQLGDESLALCDHAERMAKIQGW